MNQVADFVVVGGGSAGAVLGARLTASGKHTATILEAGGSDLSLFILPPTGSLRLPLKHFWRYRTEPDPTRAGRTDSWSSARVLGGGSSINGMLWVRGNPADYDTWAESGADGGIREYPAVPSTGGDLDRCAVRSSRTVGAAIRLVSSYRASHHPAVPSGCGGGRPARRGRLQRRLAVRRRERASQSARRTSGRYGTGRSYLWPARWRRNLDVRTHATASRVLFEDRRAVGIEYLRRGTTHRVHAWREVVVCGGAVGSPALLHRSGVGPAGVLRDLNVAIIADVPAVGQGLQEHPTFTMKLDVTERTLNQELTFLSVARAAKDFALHRSGLATATLAHALAFGKLHEQARWAEYELMFAPMAGLTSHPEAVPGSEGARTPGIDKQRLQLSDDASVSCHVCPLHPRSTGQVRAPRCGSPILTGTGSPPPQPTRGGPAR